MPDAAMNNKSGAALCVISSLNEINLAFRVVNTAGAIIVAN